MTDTIANQPNDGQVLAMATLAPPGVAHMALNPAQPSPLPPAPGSSSLSDPQTSGAPGQQGQNPLLIPVLPFALPHLFPQSMAQPAPTPVRLPPMNVEPPQTPVSHQPPSPTGDDSSQQGSRNTYFKKLNWVNASPQHFSTDDASVLGKKRRRRTSAMELEVLEAHFRRNPLPNASEREQLARETGMTARCVQVWFQNKRQSLKKKVATTERRKSSIPDSPLKQEPNASLGAGSVTPKFSVTSPSTSTSVPFLPIFPGSTGSSLPPGASLASLFQRPIMLPPQRAQTPRPIRPAAGDEGHDMAALALVNLSQSGQASPPGPSSTATASSPVPGQSETEADGAVSNSDETATPAIEGKNQNLAQFSPPSPVSPTKGSMVKQEQGAVGKVSLEARNLFPQAAEPQPQPQPQHPTPPLTQHDTDSLEKPQQNPGHITGAVSPSVIEPAQTEPV
ncbi:uncharacterized protein SPPG_04779 [Spizellomyces punctatus DAOM BR117]|uniref:Homeobox domain-containing protein n=1 Tax=Spizellomyces punctatus (strain DAOM BR117) TaxID=645134 RepID=A0A0L0HG41_SPIPD|nr:hypothetical protein, variant [Spizellomyces punctatus DAOM BR117]XP_016608501.1 uncharacterized protein SPPG_04779 [Spizellomyces punctatus DAOM BR117]KND00461.1 hypothetical protein, variant [Spizellomyces punctatus DAOM BR117]KND00462.1 hypothetical protein SPPG_04779 [Spizellomyces punctatus DAOM BR117]|eukprot:XP_016608500.1 hypothetical protein, variant [Spizellomyces punctatus DAOM BR117]